MSRSESNLTKYYTLDRVILEHVQEAKNLGVILSEDLKWAKHIQFITAKANSTLGLHRQNVHHCPEKLCKQAFISLVRSRLEYSSTVWDPYQAQDIDKIEMVQKRGARYVKQEFHHMASVTALLEDLQWPELAQRRREARLALMYKIIHGKVAIPVDDILKQPDKRTRKKHKFTNRHLDPNIEQFRNSFFTRTIPEWNNLSESAVRADSTHEHYTRLPRIAHYSSRSRSLSLLSTKIYISIPIQRFTMKRVLMETIIIFVINSLYCKFACSHCGQELISVSTSGRMIFYTSLIAGSVSVTKYLPNMTC